MVEKKEAEDGGRIDGVDTADAEAEFDARLELAIRRVIAGERVNISASPSFQPANPTALAVVASAEVASTDFWKNFQESWSTG